MCNGCGAGYGPGAQPEAARAVLGTRQSAGNHETDRQTDHNG